MIFGAREPKNRGGGLLIFKLLLKMCVTVCVHVD